MAWRKPGFALVMAGLVLGLGGVLSASAWGETEADTVIPKASLPYAAEGGGLTNQEVGSFSVVVVTGEVKGKRLLVVDSDDRIIGIWSNTSSLDHTLIVRTGRMDGPEHPMSENILRQYEELKGGIDWAQTGLVFTSGS